MRSVCLYFQVHQPYRLRTYRFFNIGQDHYYYDDYQNRHIIRRVAEKCYLPANRMMLQLINEFGKGFKVSYSISGTALDQFAQYVPEVIDSFRQLAATGCVEFISETEYHSLASLGNEKEFIRQVETHTKRIEELFGQKPQTFRNSELIYSDVIGEMAANMGFHTMLTEGAKHVLGWKSPNYIYCNNLNPKLRVLLRNFRLSDDVSFRFSEQNWSEWPLTAEKFVGWLNAMDPQEEVVNLFLDYETIGEHQLKESGIFDFFYHLPSTVFAKSNFTFATPEELYQRLQPMAALSVPYAISWADEERDLTAWKGNELQAEALSKLYSLSDAIAEIKDPVLKRDWGYLQSSNHFYYMSTKWFSAGEIHKHFNPYGSPYDAFINYMNVISDFAIRVEASLLPAVTGSKPEKSKTAGKALKKTSAVKTKAVEKKIKAGKLKAEVKEKKAAKPRATVKETKAEKSKAGVKEKKAAKIKAAVKETKAIKPKAAVKEQKSAKPKAAAKAKPAVAVKVAKTGRVSKKGPASEKA